MFKDTFGEDPRRYNIPKTGEIAIVFIGEEGNPPGHRDLAIYPKSTMAKILFEDLTILVQTWIQCATLYFSFTENQFGDPERL